MSQRVFAFVADGDVFMRVFLDEEADPKNAGYVAGLLSNPTIVEVTDIDLPVEQGWTYDGENFYPPQD